jgi:hypothetical protein
MPKLPETLEEIEAFWKKVDENDAVEVKLELYFPKEEVAGMCDLEKLRVSNLKRNYDMMKEMGKFGGSEQSMQCANSVETNRR